MKEINSVKALYQKAQGNKTLKAHHSSQGSCIHYNGEIEEDDFSQNHDTMVKVEKCFWSTI